MRLALLATGDIGLPSFDALLQHPHHHLAVLVTQPDKPVGRKQTLTPPQIKLRAQAAGIPVLQPPRLRAEIDALKAFHTDLFIVVAYGQLLPRSVLDIPARGCLNIHASLLPRHRGASPIQAAIREGDPESGITIMWMDEGLDTGDILLQQSLALAPDETGGSLHDRLAHLAPSCLLQALDLIQAGSAPRLPQDPLLATHCRKLERLHGRLDWNCGAPSLERLIRAYNPWPGAWCQIVSGNGLPVQLKIHRAHLTAAMEAANPGVVSTDGQRLTVACGEGALELLEVQLEGRKRMTVPEFLRGHSALNGAVLQ